MPRGYWTGRTVTWTEGQIEMLKLAYSGESVGLDAISVELGKLKSNVSRKARELGLTRRGRKHSAEVCALISRKARARMKDGDHPRGMLGKNHTPEAKAAMSVSQCRVVAEGRKNLPPVSEARRQALSLQMQQRLRGSSSVYSRTKSGRRDDLGGQFFRSRWEANYARYLNLLISHGHIAKWEFEPDTFWFESIRRGVRSYMPDFKIWRPNGTLYYVEVKGWMDAKSATKLRRMAKYHPHIELQLFEAKAYRELSRKLGGAISGWEFDK